MNNFWFLACGIALATEWRKPKLGIYIAGLAFCAALELVQVWIPGRHARLSDFVVNACATATGIALTRMLQAIRPATQA